MIRPMTAADEQPVAALLDALWGHDASMRGIYNIHRVWEGDLLRQTLVAEAAGEVVGVGTVLESRIHTDLLMASAHVAPDHQRQGTGTQLAAALADLGDGRGWLVKATRRDAASMAFLASQGFAQEVRTLTGTLDLNDARVQAWAADQLSEGVDLVWQPLAQGVEHLYAVYVNYHLWSLPNPHLKTVMQQQPIVDDRVLCAVQGGAVVGAGCLLGKDVPHVAWVGAVDDAPYNTVIAPLIGRLVQVASTDYAQVTVEADDTMPVQWALYEAAPLQDRDAEFVIMVKK